MRSLFTFVLSALFIFNAEAQNPERFKADMENFKTVAVPEGEVTVFTGSSSIRFWLSLRKDCEDATIINTGFGGSEASDLLYYLNEAVLRFRPSKVFIYEGDNDINSGKTPQNVLKTTSQIVGKIRTELPGTQIFILSTKPSPSRWQHKDEYLELNQLLETYCQQMEQVSYIDVWDIMINEKGRPKPEIFVADSLHMNGKGYAIWKATICQYTN